jgi:hypothetical protein
MRINSPLLMVSFGLLVACVEGKQRNKPDSEPVNAGISASASVHAADSAPPVPSENLTPSAAKAVHGAAESEAHCKAIGSKKAANLGTHNSPIVYLTMHHNALFALSQIGYGGGYGIYRIAKDGSGVKLLTKFVSADRDIYSFPNRIAVDESGVYFSKHTGAPAAGNDILYRVALDGGAASVVSEQFGAIAGIYEGYMYAVVSRRRQRLETIVRISTKDGKIDTLFTRPIGRNGYLDAPFMFTDMQVGAAGVILADQGTGSLLKLPHEGGTATTLLTHKFLINDLHLVGSRVFFGCGSEMAWIGYGGVKESVDISGANHLTFESMQKLWAAASDNVNLYELGRGDPNPANGDVPRVLVLGSDGKRTYGPRLQQIEMTEAVVDAECIYYTRIDPADVTWYSAIPKPAL